LTGSAHRHRAPDGFWRERGALTPIIPAERELIRRGARRIMAGQSLRGLALEWKDRGLQGRRRP
jgi:hypothetical protein